MKLPARKDDTEIRRLATMLVGNRVVAAHAVPRDMIGSIFMPIAMGALKGYRREQIAKLAVFAIDGEDTTLRMYVNGYPMFASCRLWHYKDFNRAVDLADAMRNVGTP